jgi:prophage regulatory protein
MGKRFLRLPQVLERLPISKSTWWQGIRDGRFPRPVKLSERASGWEEGEIDALCDQLAGQINGAGNKDGRKRGERRA